MAPSRNRRRLAALSLATIFALGACQTGPSRHVVRGVVTEVQPRDIAHADWIVFRTESGQESRFRVADSVQFPPSHLREHMLFQEPVTLTYLDDPAGPLATSITD